MQPSTYFKLSAKNIRASEEEFFSGLCFDKGATGISEDLDFDQSDDAFNVKTLWAAKKSLWVFFDNKPGEDFMGHLQAQFPEVSLELKSEVNKDWLAEWKKGFDSFELCEGHWVVPSWLDPPESATSFMRIDPGLAFGTGTHETTKLVSGILKDYALSGGSLLDVGTGTGIVAILAQQLGFKDISATEIDEMARQVARENLELNRVLAEVPDEQVDELEGPYDVVVANIIDGVLVDIQGDLYRLLKPGGRLILSGILEERDSKFKTKFSAFNNYKTLERRQLNEWVGYVLEKPHA